MKKEKDLGGVSVALCESEEVEVVMPYVEVLFSTGAWSVRICQAHFCGSNDLAERMGL